MGKTLIIAEAGVNHNGSIETAKKLAEVAKECGADIVKFQTAKLSSLVSKSARMADYQKENLKSDESQYDMLKSLILSYDEFEDLANYCDEIEIKFLSTPFDLESIEFLKKFNMGMWKIPSGEITNLPYLRIIAKTYEKIILSTGMCTMDEVRASLKVLRENGADDITLLHCTTEYPAKISDVNLNAMLRMEEEFGCPIGYSDHTPGITIPIAAAALGATVIEKHFTLDRKMPGPDHKASLEPDELRAMVKAIRDVEQAMGDGNKVPTEAEIKNRSAARKSIVAKCIIKKGDILSEDNITVKRPGDGISPMLWDDVIGTKAIKDFYEDELIQI